MRGIPRAAVQPLHEDFRISKLWYSAARKAMPELAQIGWATDKTLSYGSLM
jgi:hypothetical protein